eukprot:2298097-Prymnesium_polylepis.1
MALWDAVQDKPVSAAEVTIKLPLGNDASLTSKLMEGGWDCAKEMCKELQTKFAWRQVDLAKALGVSGGLISQMFHEKNEYITARNLTHGGRMIKADAIKWAESILYSARNQLWHSGSRRQQQRKEKARGQV